MGSIIRFFKPVLFVAIAHMAALNAYAQEGACELATMSVPLTRAYADTIFQELAPKLNMPVQKLKQQGLLPWILKRMKAPERIVFFSLNPRRGDLIIDFLPDIAAIRNIYPHAQIILLTPHSDLVQSGLKNFKNVQIKDARKLARELYDQYIDLNGADFNTFDAWNFQPLLAEMKTYLTPTTMVFTNSDLQPLIHATREWRYEELRRMGVNITHMTFYTSWLEARMNARFEKTLEQTFRASASPAVMTYGWLKTMNIGTIPEKLWTRSRPEFEGRKGPLSTHDMAYPAANFQREINYGSHNVIITPSEFLLAKNISDEEQRFLDRLPENFVLINLNKGEQRRLNLVETDSAVFLDKILSRMSHDYPGKKFIMLDIHESWRTKFEREFRPNGEWMGKVNANRRHLLSLTEKYGSGGWFRIVSAPDSYLPHIIQRAESVITQDSGLAHTATSILGAHKTLMLSVDEMGLLWLAPNQPTIYDIDSWSKISDAKLEEVLAAIKALLK